MTVFDKAAKVVGDLDSPFYAEERQRDVWNEASAVGFQTLLWGGLVLGCAMAWFGGDEVRPWTTALLLLMGLGGTAAIGYANSRGVQGTEGARLLRPRLFLGIALGVATVAGMIFGSGVETDLESAAGTVAGAIVGAGGAAGIWWFAARARRRAQED